MEKIEFLKDVLQTVLKVHKKQQKTLFAYIAVFQTFKQSYPQYAAELNDSLATALASPVLDDRELAEFERVLERFYQSSPPPLSDSEIAEIQKALAQIQGMN